MRVDHRSRNPFPEELAETLLAAGAQTLVDVRRYLGSRRNPQFNREELAAALVAGGIRYRHAVELGGRRSGEQGEALARIRVAAFRSYAARMGQAEWLAALADALAEPSACLMCAETPWQLSPPLDRRPADRPRPRVIHSSVLGNPSHTFSGGSRARDGKLYLCGELVA